VSAARDFIAKAMAHRPVVDSSTASAALDKYRDEVLREAAVTVRALAPKYLDNEVDLAIFHALDMAAGLIDPAKGAGT
jgi:hypothetical protein